MCVDLVCATVCLCDTLPPVKFSSPIDYVDFSGETTAAQSHCAPSRALYILLPSPVDCQTMTSTGIKGTVLITGANGGLATAFIEKLIESHPPYYGVFTVRGTSAQSSAVLAKAVSNTDFPHSILPLDLDDLISVRNFAKDINSKVSSRQLPKIRALILNAAIQTFNGVTHTKGGIEMNFGVNYLANFLLVLLLLQSMDSNCYCFKLYS
jgi:hypothetical protein